MSGHTKIGLRDSVAIRCALGRALEELRLAADTAHRVDLPDLTEAIRSSANRVEDAMDRAREVLP